MLGAKENDDLLEGCAPGVQYALRRLVRGLGSSREVTWLKFFSSLGCDTEIVKHHELFIRKEGSFFFAVELSLLISFLKSECLFSVRGKDLRPR